MWTTKDMPDQSGKTIIITGANTGIGYETALALYKAGAHVVLACRNVNNAWEAKSRTEAAGGNGSLETAVLNLANLAAVKQFSDEFLSKHSQLDILIGNAGVMIPPASNTDDGWELQFGVNFIGHFALTGYLYPLLNATQGSRIVMLSSNAYLHGVINFDNLKSEIDYEPMREYQQSKLADILLSVELQRRIEAKGHQTVSIAAQPGANKTDLSRHMNQDAFNAAVERMGGLMDPWQGALLSLYAATSADAIGGKLYGPDEQNHYKGYPAEQPIIPRGMDEDV